MRTVPFAAACALWMLAGCTFLVDFEEVPTNDAGPDAPVNVPADVRVDAPAQQDGSGDGDVRIDAPADARDGNPGFVTACNGKADGKYCPGNQITWPGDKDDLVTCKAGKVFSTTRCTTGTGCIFMLAGYPDECDQCATKATGTYCGRDMPGWDTKNTNFRVRCQSGAQVGLLLCNGTCNSNGGASTCP